MIDKIIDIYKGQTMWIVGKGPSLQYLKERDIGLGPVITINDAIVKVEELDLSNSIFSLQKDGGDRMKYCKAKTKFGHPLFIPDCDYTPDCGDRCGGMVRPKKGAILLVHLHESLYCMPDYSPRYIFCFQQLGFLHNQFSLIIAIRIGLLMGCESFRFVSFDLYITGSCQSYTPGVGLRWGEYRNHIKRTKPHIKDLDYKWVIPKEGK